MSKPPPRRAVDRVRDTLLELGVPEEELIISPSPSHVIGEAGRGGEIVAANARKIASLGFGVDISRYKCGCLAGALISTQAEHLGTVRYETDRSLDGNFLHRAVCPHNPKSRNA